MLNRSPWLTRSACVLALCVCGAMVSASAPPPADWEKFEWTDRVAHVLRGGRGLETGDSDTLAQLALLDRGAIIDRLMTEPLFGDAVLDFGLYFLGSKPDQLTDPQHSRYDVLAANSPQAIAAALETLQGGDFLKLLDYTQPVYQGVLERPYLYATADPNDAKLGDTELRLKYEGMMQDDRNAVIAFAQQTPPPATNLICNRAEALLSSNDRPNFFNVNLPDSLSAGSDGIFSQEWYGKIYSLCSKPAATTPAALLAALQDIDAKDQLLYKKLATFEAGAYVQHDVRDFRLLDMSGILSKPLVATQFGPRLRQLLLNSSTNFDRKRAAFVLKRYFCDDLTPIAVQNPAQHAGDVHGTNPECLKCHYVLDPMAGFFRDLGVGFVDFTGGKQIQFDDNARADLATYEANWKAPDGSGRVWNVGYVRDTRKTELNSYGSSLNDLFGIIRQAPEVRQCVVQRMFEYFVGRDRLLDQGYLESLSQGFGDGVAAGRSAQAFKATVKQLLLSNSFAQTDPKPDQCYDSAPGSDPANAPPCQAAFLLKKNCAQCHSQVDEKYGNLDLTHWVKLPDGSYDFPHLDDGGNQKTRKQTFDKLIERLTTTDPERRMPYKCFISHSDLVQLNDWFLKSDSGEAP